jgi:acetyl esterase/lipase
VDRRTVIGLGAALLSGLPHVASAANEPPLMFPLWPEGRVPDTTSLDLAPEFAGPSDNRIATGIAAPSMCLVSPAKPDGSALLIVPGGGYMQETIDVEGFEIARRFADAGVTCFVLSYRLPNEGWTQGPLAPIQDIQRAIRLIRANASSLSLDVMRVAAIGFSAGGHMVATLAARNGEEFYKPVDAIDRLDPRPTIFATGYAVVTMELPYVHEASREHFLGQTVTDAQRRAWSVERYVKEGMPSGFLFACNDDPYVPVENTLALAAAMRAKRVTSETHIFESGGHGFGLRVPTTSTAGSWPDLFLRWGRTRGVFKS